MYNFIIVYLAKGVIIIMIIVLEREKLYEEVWKIKMKELAHQYGVSEATLRKHCRALNVPIPQSGYWMKVRNGSPTKITQLPKFQGENKIIIQKNEYKQKSKYTKDNMLKHLNDSERKKVHNVCCNIRVPQKLNRPHCLIKDCEIYRFKNDRIRDGLANNMNLKISEKHKNRGFRILDTIFKTIEKLGYEIKSQQKDTRICIAGQEVKIGLKEKLVRIKNINSDNNSYYSTQYEYKFSGNLILFIDEYRSPKKEWKDKESKNIEDMIEEFIIAIIDTAEILRKDEERRRIEKENERQRQIVKFKLEKRKEHELKKVDELKKSAENYKASKMIDEYIAELERISETLDNDEIKTKLCEYIKWAKQKSDWLNPLKRIDDDILGRKYSDDIYNLEFEENEDYWWRV